MSNRLAYRFQIRIPREESVQEMHVIGDVGNEQEGSVESTNLFKLEQQLYSLYGLKGLMTSPHKSRLIVFRG